MPDTPASTAVDAPEPMPDTAGGLVAALDVLEPAPGAAGEAWALMSRFLYPGGRPRLPAIAQELGLHPGQAHLMLLLAEPAPMGELAKAMRCDSSNITGIVDRLEERGLVERCPREHDRRVKLIALTAEGVRVRRNLNERLAKPPTGLSELPDSDLKRLVGVLSRALERDDGAHPPGDGSLAC